MSIFRNLSAKHGSHHRRDPARHHGSQENTTDLSQQCPHCRSLNDTKARFCKSCGKAITAFCNQCKQEVSSKAAYCSQCGADVKSGRTD